MTKKEKNEQELGKWITSDRIIAVSKGYKSMAQEVLDMMKDGKTIDEIKEKCEWYVGYSEIAAEGAIKK